MPSINITLKAMAAHAMMEAAARAYVEAIGKNYDENREAILDEAGLHVEAVTDDMKLTIRRAHAAGLTKADTRLAGEIMANGITALGLAAAAKVCGEPPAKDAEAQPAGEAIH